MKKGFMLKPKFGMGEKLKTYGALFLAVSLLLASPLACTAAQYSRSEERCAYNIFGWTVYWWGEKLVWWTSGSNITGMNVSYWAGTAWWSGWGIKSQGLSWAICSPSLCGAEMFAGFEHWYWGTHIRYLRIWGYPNGTSVVAWG